MLGNCIKSSSLNGKMAVTSQIFVAEPFPNKNRKSLTNLNRVFVCMEFCSRRIFFLCVILFVCHVELVLLFKAL